MLWSSAQGAICLNTSVIGEDGPVAREKSVEMNTDGLCRRPGVLRYGRKNP